MTPLIPLPVEHRPAAGIFHLTAATRIEVDPAVPETLAAGAFLADLLAPACGFRLPVKAKVPSAGPGCIQLDLRPALTGLGTEGYRLAVSPSRIELEAPAAAGLFYGIQTLRQLLPPAVESAAARPGPWIIPAGTIIDYPRFPWRGAMLDVARHFFVVDDVRRFIDLMAAYKLNRLHLHLTDDQGWRLMIERWPDLAAVGGRSAVGGDRGGWYTRADYGAIVAHAAARGITIVPEIDLPGHTNAALSAYPELNPDGVAPPPYTGTEVGFSTLTLDRESTQRFLDEVLGEVAAMTPGPYLHIGGDEAHQTSPTAYAAFIERVQAIVSQHGKTMVGWEEIGRARLAPGAIVQHWHSADALRGAAQGAGVILSPASRIYLDMKYGPETPLGLDWAGAVNVEAAYDWEPARWLDGLDEAAILGVEAPLWTETLRRRPELEWMAFPRLAGVAEIGWSPAAARSWPSYRPRLAAQGPRWEQMGVNFYRSPEIDWE